MLNEGLNAFIKAICPEIDQCVHYAELQKILHSDLAPISSGSVTRNKNLRPTHGTRTEKVLFIYDDPFNQGKI